jgi:hypothetical protein
MTRFVKHTAMDSEQAIRWLIALMVLCCDPLAIALTAAASAGGESWRSARRQYTETGRGQERTRKTSS